MLKLLLLVLVVSVQTINIQQRTQNHGQTINIQRRTQNHGQADVNEPKEHPQPEAGTGRDRKEPHGSLGKENQATEIHLHNVDPTNGHKAEDNSLPNHINSFQDEIEVLPEDTADKLDNNNLTLTTDNKLISVINSNLKQRANNTNKNSAGNNLEEPLYAFDAVSSSNREISASSLIIFDKVSTNVGGLYFNTTSQFACVDTAVYFFAWSVAGDASDSGERCIASLRKGADIVKNGPKSNYARGYSSGNSEMVSLVECRTSVPTAITVIASPGTSPTPTYRADLTSFLGFRLAQPENVVGFVAELSQNIPEYPDRRIVFDRVLANYGGNYDDLHGYFRCPDNGIYSFSLTTNDYDNQGSNNWSVSRIMFNRTLLVQCPSTHMWFTSDVTDSGSASVSVVMQCQQGLDVYVES